MKRKAGNGNGRRAVLPPPPPLSLLECVLGVPHDPHRLECCCTAAQRAGLVIKFKLVRSFSIHK